MKIHYAAHTFQLEFSWCKIGQREDNSVRFGETEKSIYIILLCHLFEQTNSSNWHFSSVSRCHISFVDYVGYALTAR